MLLKLKIRKIKSRPLKLHSMKRIYKVFKGVKCSVRVVSTGEHCPKKPSKELNGDPVCEECYDTWKLILNKTR